MARCVPQEAGDSSQIASELRRNRHERDSSGEKVHIHGHVCCCRMQQLLDLRHVAESPQLTGPLVSSICCHLVDASGKSTLIVVPFPSSLSTMIEPWCSSMIPLTTVNPNPVPWPNSFVVKNGSKIFLTNSFGIP